MKKIAIVFSGQGSQYVGMGKDLYENYAEAKEIFDQAQELLQQDIQQLMFEGEKDILKQTQNAQLAVFITSMAAYRVFEERCGIKPSIAAGHSLGEISALTAAKALSFEDALLLVRDRGKYMQKACDEKCGKMYAIRDMHPSYVKQMCETDENVWISNYNTKNQIVISGESESVKKLAEKMEMEGAIVQELVVSGAFHSGLMKSASMLMQERVKQVQINEPVIPVVSNTSASFEGKNEIGDNLYQQIVMPVRWSETIDIFSKLGIDTAIEFGAGHALSNMIKVQNKCIDTYLFEKVSDINATIDSINANYSEKKLSYFEKCLSIAVCTKNNNPLTDDYEEHVLKNVDRIRSFIDNKEQDDKTIAFEALKDILTYKKVSNEEMQEQFRELV